ncbi:TRAP transporter large permease subunit [Lutimaribacter sp. EGI FJ00015]|uniref:TRAP transporter large permease subunit n=1 Tax=Lutimaribacter degradans TaxID=2945989 RepID=A0ACC6A0P4_9RHOB|nr:TRAP transporter large permease subunit [Lutimaribacter sp. EGI FJ00013]MCM2563571.1 TRAP transporter large permease subunit [Lutimaribacter sp. EGI FJ00013]MCO0614766.1 TRAP transporter large permease subunit [Lutimaribacter sp. EGI FJ00015]MCO0637435.1 TRAP transporter large permease subunit [Lutimaribacter sp. EGI FJ00014]
MELFFLLILVLLMATALGSGYPVAFALPGAAIISIGLAAGAGYLFAGNADAYFHSGGPSQWLSAGVLNLRGVYWEVERDTLIAIPLFIFMGLMLQRSKIAEDLLVTMAQLFGPVPGGLGISVVFVGALLAATTGIVGATVVAMGLISLPAMLRSNYSAPLATGTISASGTLGQIIPPSIVLIILADQLASATDQASTARKALHKAATGEISMPSEFDVSSTSAGEMFLGAFVPGMVLVGLYMLYILVFAIIRPKSAPAVSYEGKYDRRFWATVALTLIPPLALIFLVLGSIIAGIATVNQAGAVGAAGALVMAGYRLYDNDRGKYMPALMAIAGIAVIVFALSNYEMNIKAANTPEDFTGITIGAVGAAILVASLLWSGARTLRIDNTLQGVMLETAKTTSLVFIILLGAAMLTAAFRAFGGEELVREFLNSLPGGFWMKFVIVMTVIFVLGFFLDFIEIAVVVVPIVAPILLADPSANITAVWLGVMIGLNIQTSFLTPPFGFALFYLRGVAPASVRTLQIYKGVIPFIALQLLALGIVGASPQLVNYLPNRVSLLSDSAPPPRNPRFQYCLDAYSAEQVADGAERGALERMRAQQLAVLPDDLADDLGDALESADTALTSLAEIDTTYAAVRAAAGEFRPKLANVRRIEREIRGLEEEAEELKTMIQRMRDPAMDARKAELQALLDSDLAEIEALRATIPESWGDDYAAFSDLINAELKARNTYRRNADDAYEDAAAVLAVLESNAGFDALQAELESLREVIETADPEEGEEIIDVFEDRVDEVAGTRDIKRSLSSARRALGDDEREEALADHQDAVQAYAAQQEWRAAAAAQLQEPLSAYVAAIRGSLGVRVQDSLTREQALYLARCQSDHRDLSLNF